MNEIEIRANAMLRELAAHHKAALDRSVNLAADNAELSTENAALKARIAELEKTKEPAA